MTSAASWPRRAGQENRATLASRAFRPLRSLDAARLVHLLDLLGLADLVRVFIVRLRYAIQVLLRALHALQHGPKVFIAQVLGDLAPAFTSRAQGEDVVH